MRGLSIDVGAKNFAFYIEEFNHEKLLKMENFSINKDLPEVFGNGRRVFLEVKDFREGLAFNDVKVLLRLGNYLDSNLPLWDTVSIIVIERQFKKNFVAQRLEHFCLSYFLLHYGEFKIITDIAASRKTMLLKAPRMNKPQRKKWAIKKAKEIFKLRKDEDGLKIIDSSPKKDDLSDAILQFNCFKILFFIQKGF